MTFKCLILLKYFVAMYPRVFSTYQEHVDGGYEGMDGHEAANSRTRGRFMFGLGDLVVVNVDMFKDSFKFSRKFILVNNCTKKNVNY